MLIQTPSQGRIPYFPHEMLPRNAAALRIYVTGPEPQSLMHILTSVLPTSADVSPALKIPNLSEPLPDSCKAWALGCVDFSSFISQAVHDWSDLAAAAAAAAAAACSSVAVVHWLSCPAACRIFPDLGWNLRPLHWQADSQPLNHQGGSPS